MGNWSDTLFMSGAEFNEMTESIGRAGGSGLRRLLEGDINTPGLITLVVVVGILCFLYWAIRHR